MNRVYSITSVDQPEVVKFLKTLPDVSRDYPRYTDGKVITMWNLIPKKLMPPRINVRYCCEKLKERYGRGRLVVTGVRWAESKNRTCNQALIKKFGKSKREAVMLHNDNDESRKMVENCYKKAKTLMNPIIDWTDEDVWEFIRSENIPYCELYDYGHDRLGCIGCPNSARQEEELNTYPVYKENYIRAFDRMITRRRELGKPTTWNSGEEVIRWWLAKETNPAVDGQLAMEELEY
ncbi:phosphoadenosine phosphosulfate reductase family protein [Christensenellaceae bacterium OttesenSCG-928-K19]|nr:phosphoadenosine phosphosulfate reductase family protein [Christensenellaceae bacterium OttesenSCG-928-K19]